MSPRSVICLGLLILALSSFGFSQSVPKLDRILPRVQEHIKEFEHSLPDFICDEKITPRELMGGKTIHETDIDSTFRGTQNRDKNTDKKYQPFTEWRDVQTIDGRPAPKGQQLTGPFLFGGGFSSILVEIFSPENSRYFNILIRLCRKACFLTGGRLRSCGDQGRNFLDAQDSYSRADRAQS